MRLWMKVECGLSKHPKIRAFAALYGVKPQLVVGFLLDWWGYCTEYGKAGQPAKCHSDVMEELFADVRSLSKSIIIPDVKDALLIAGLMDDNGDPHDWEEYAGAVLTKRAVDKQRQKLYRESKKAGAISCHGDVTSQSRVENKQKDIDTHTGKKAPTRLSPDQVREAYRTLGKAG